MHFLILWQGVFLSAEAWDFAGVYRGAALGLSMRSESFLGVLRWNDSDHPTLCYTILRSNKQFISALYSSLRLVGDLNISFTKESDSPMSNHTRIDTLLSSVPACDDRAGAQLSIPRNMIYYYDLVSTCARGTFYQQTGSPRLKKELDRLRLILLSLISGSLDSEPLSFLSSPFECTINYSELLHLQTQNLSTAGFVWAILHLLGIYLVNICDIPLPLDEDFSTLEAFDYLNSSSGFILPPTEIGDNPYVITDETIPQFFLKDSSFDPLTKILKLSPASLAYESSRSVSAPTSCPESLAPPQLGCEEIPSYLCSAYEGCYIAWGPCQSVSLGYYSPLGLTSQVPCPPLPSDQTFVPVSALDSCRSTCRDSTKVRIDGACIAPSSGEVTVTYCNGTTSIVSCDTNIDGWIYTESGSCSGRYLAVGLGTYHAVSPESLTIQTWVRINSVASNAMFPLYGLFGSCFLGIQYVDESSIALFLFLMSDLGVNTLKSDPIPHISGSQWGHVAVTVDQGIVSFYFNAVSVGISRISIGDTKSVPSLMSSLLSPAVSSQLLKHINREHYGPFRLLPADLTGNIAGNPWKSYLTTTFIDFELYNPRTDNRVLQVYELDFFENAPEGVHANDVLNYSMMPIRTECANLCLSDMGRCGPACGEDIWDPFECRCTPKEVFCASTTTSGTPEESYVQPTELATKSTEMPTSGPIPTTTRSHAFTGTSSSTLCSTTSTTNEPRSVEPAGNLSGDVALIICMCLVFLLCIWYFLRRRTARRISASTSTIFSLPEIQWIDEVHSDRPFIHSLN